MSGRLKFGFETSFSIKCPEDSNWWFLSHNSNVQLDCGCNKWYFKIKDMYSTALCPCRAKWKWQDKHVCPLGTRSWSLCWGNVGQHIPWCPGGGRGWREGSSWCMPVGFLVWLKLLLPAGATAVSVGHGVTGWVRRLPSSTTV